jgi:hypothetical protein
MKNGSIAFQADGVRVFSMACFCRERRRCQTAQTAMRTTFVIVAPPVGDDAPGLEEVLEPVDEQTLFAQLAVEALHIAILRVFPWLDVNQVDLSFQISRQKVPTS